MSAEPSLRIRHSQCLILSCFDRFPSAINNKLFYPDVFVKCNFLHALSFIVCLCCLYYILMRTAYFPMHLHIIQDLSVFHSGNQSFICIFAVCDCNLVLKFIFSQPFYQNLMFFHKSFFQLQIAINTKSNPMRTMRIYPVISILLSNRIISSACSDVMF